jgi:hypothetical protein
MGLLNFIGVITKTIAYTTLVGFEHGIVNVLRWSSVGKRIYSRVPRILVGESFFAKNSVGCCVGFCVVCVGFCRRLRRFLRGFHIQYEI